MPRPEVAKLAADIAEGRTLLFAGAGLSRPMGLPGWAQLTEHMAEELGYDPDILIGPGRSSFDHMAMAEFYELEQGGRARGGARALHGLQSWMRSSWNIPAARMADSPAHRLILKLNFPIIYTTNYDHLIELSCEQAGVDYVKIVSAKDLAKVNSNSGAARAVQIVKLHGDYDHAASMVLTETDYYERLTFSAALDIKLRADALERSILFVGYSLSDVNVRLMLYSIHKIWMEELEGVERPSSYIFMTRPDPIQERIMQSWGVAPLIGDVDDPHQALLSLLQELIELGASRS